MKIVKLRKLGALLKDFLGASDLDPSWWFAELVADGMEVYGVFGLRNY